MRFSPPASFAVPVVQDRPSVASGQPGVHPSGGTPSAFVAHQKVRSLEVCTRQMSRSLNEVMRQLTQLTRTPSSGCAVTLGKGGHTRIVLSSPRALEKRRSEGVRALHRPVLSDTLYLLSALAIMARPNFEAPEGLFRGGVRHAHGRSK